MEVDKTTNCKRVNSQIFSPPNPTDPLGKALPATDGSHDALADTPDDDDDDDFTSPTVETSSRPTSQVVENDQTPLLGQDNDNSNVNETNEVQEPPDVTPAATLTSPTPLAFTIQFGSNKEVDTTKYKNLFERYNARHQRNLSTSKVEINAKKPSPASLLSPGTVQKQKAPSTHSEGYFSSEDDGKRKSEHFSQKLKQLGSRSLFKAQSASRKSEMSKSASMEHPKTDLMTRSYEEQSKRVLSRDKLSLELKNTTKGDFKAWEPPRSATINDLSRVQKVDYNEEKGHQQEKIYQKNIEYIDVKHKYSKEEENSEDCNENYPAKVSNVKYVSNSEFSSKKVVKNSARDSNLSSVSCTMDTVDDSLEKTNLDVFNVSNTDAGSDEAVSEAGTYTIHKDYTDEEKARMDIDKVFSVGVLTEDENNEAYVHSFKMSISRDNNTWISEWATQVAEHHSLPPVIGGTTGRTPPMSPSKIPSPIHNRSQRLSRSRHEQSDSSLDTESYLRIKERISTIPTNQSTLIDSGGESDDDTSNSYNTPPHSSQRTPTHTSLMRRGSLSESLFRRIGINESRRSLRKYMGSETKLKKEEESTELLSPTQAFAAIHLGRRSSSLDRREYTSDTAESNTSRKSSLKYYPEDSPKHTNSPILNRLKPSTPKLTNSPILARKESTKIINSPMLERTKHLAISSPQAKNIGYFTCIENSPYMLRKSNSTTNYHETTSIHGGKELSATTISLLQNSPVLQRHLNIQRSSSNSSIRNVKNTALPARRSSFNNSDTDRSSLRGRFNIGSDSSSEAGDHQSRSIAPVSSGIKLNRAFSIRRGRLSCESDTTPNTTPEERRKRVPPEVKSVQSSTRQQGHHRPRTSSVGPHSKEALKKCEIKQRTPSISRTDTGRFSTRAPKNAHSGNAQRTTQKSTKDHKKSGRSNSTLTSKEVEFQNWKRRKSYDPMKAAAEGRKKQDGTKKNQANEDSSSNHDNSVLRSASFHGTGGTLALANDWSDSMLDYAPEDNQVPPPSSPQLESDSDLETSSYLQATQNVVSAMSARITAYRSPLVDSDGESDDDTSQSLHQTTKAHEPTDSESSDEPAVNQSPITNTKYNRAFSLRRARLEPQPTKVSNSAVNKTKTPLREVRGKSEPSSGIARTDSGRFSMRLSRNSSVPAKAKPKETKKAAAPKTRDVEMENWKRRKSYDPMKAAMEGRKKAGLAKRTVTSNLSPSHVARSQSFHGSMIPGTGVTSDWSDDEAAVSADETPHY